MRELHGEVLAKRTPPSDLPRPQGVFARQGAAYERNVHKALASLAKSMGATYESNVWFSFEDDEGRGQIALDGLFTFATDAIIIEAKRTYVPSATKKLAGLYAPIVSAAFGLVPRVWGISICRALTSDCENRVDRLSLAIHGRFPTLLWLNHGRIGW